MAWRSAAHYLRSGTRYRAAALILQPNRVRRLGSWSKRKWFSSRPFFAVRRATNIFSSLGCYANTIPELHDLVCKPCTQSGLGAQGEASINL